MLSYKQVTIKSDGDLHEALVSFLELVYSASSVSDEVENS